MTQRHRVACGVLHEAGMWMIWNGGPEAEDGRFEGAREWLTQSTRR